MPDEITTIELASGGTIALKPEGTHCRVRVYRDAWGPLGRHEEMKLTPEEAEALCRVLKKRH